jgi:hypothetical protein
MPPKGHDPSSLSTATSGSFGSAGAIQPRSTGCRIGAAFAICLACERQSSSLALHHGGAISNLRRVSDTIFGEEGANAWSDSTSSHQDGQARRIKVSSMSMLHLPQRGATYMSDPAEAGNWPRSRWRLSRRRSRSISGPRRAGGYFHGMVAKAVAGELHLDARCGPCAGPRSRNTTSGRAARLAVRGSGRGEDSCRRPFSPLAARQQQARLRSVKPVKSKMSRNCHASRMDNLLLLKTSQYRRKPCSSLWRSGT